MFTTEEEATAEFGTEGDDWIEHSIRIEVFETSPDWHSIDSECDERDIQVKDASNDIILVQEWLLK